MKSKIAGTLILTVIFLVVAAAAMFYHRTSDADPAQVPQGYDKTLDTTLQSQFTEELQAREGNAFGTDLGY